ncbi:exoaminopeptidase [Citrobacter koseri]|uniref:Exoaminopeptidase n=1 Tax=Citrobacter koseri TaxID=545 RepID=A0A2X2VSP7_CITKO|nr:exoaminopeptidase [Citrobacter koseri]
MLVLADKSLIAPPKLTAWVESVASDSGLPLQLDMFSNGGTDGGAVHLTGNGNPDGGYWARHASRALRRVHCGLPRHYPHAATFIGTYYPSYA